MDQQMEMDGIRESEKKLEALLQQNANDPAFMQQQLIDIFQKDVINLSDQEVIDLFIDKDLFRFTEAEKLAFYLEDLASAYGAWEMVLKMKQSYEKAVVLQEYLELHSPNYDLARGQKIRILKEQIEHI